MNLVIDVGNTRVKLAVFEQDNLKEKVIFKKSVLISEFKKILKKYTIEQAMIASVANISPAKLKRLQQLVNLQVLSYKTKLPFINKYATPKTLGVDRIACIAGAVREFPKKNVLVIDAGTCIKYDFVNAENEYLGGAISTGITMRYEALSHFTAKLPLLKASVPKNFIGNSTETSIHSGNVNGVIQEIEGVISQYQQLCKKLTIVLTGGDTKFLSEQLKSSIFANQNLLLEGLNSILNYNIKHD